MLIVNISIHAPAKGATHLAEEGTHTDIISIHAPAKGATSDADVWDFIRGFQSTLPRRERQWGICVYLAQKQISIHAPAKGATNKGSDYDCGWIISIHAPAKGATISSSHIYSSSTSISIHAPAKGATSTVKSWASRY